MTQAIKPISNVAFVLAGLAFGILFPVGFSWLKGWGLPTLLEFMVIGPLVALALVSACALFCRKS